MLIWPEELVVRVVAEPKPVNVYEPLLPLQDTAPYEDDKVNWAPLKGVVVGIELEYASYFVSVRVPGVATFLTADMPVRRVVWSALIVTVPHVLLEATKAAGYSPLILAEPLSISVYVPTGIF